MERKPTPRPGYDEYFMAMARLSDTRSTCFRRQVGAVIVKEKHVIATGYNGNPKGFAHCEDIGCIREELEVPSGQNHELCTGLHAEQNAILQAARFGHGVDGSTMYTTVFPCVICVKMMVNAGIREVVYEEGYPDPLGAWMLARSTLLVRRHGAAAPDPKDSGKTLEALAQEMKPQLPWFRGNATLKV
jgi:dCMP deaminase